MINFTHNNHLKFGWGSGLYNFDDKNEQFWETVGPAEYIPVSYKEECLRAARLISEAATKPIMIFLSGGVDSEVVARSFIDIGVYFEVVTTNILYNGEIVNVHDTRYTSEFIKHHNLKSHTVDIEYKDVVDRLTKIRETQNSSTPYYKISVAYLCQIEMFEQFCQDYHCVIGAGGGGRSLVRYRANGGPSDKYGVYCDDSSSNVAAFELSFRASADVTLFFWYTPEMLLAWLLDTDVSHWIKYEKALAGAHSRMNNHALKSFVFYKIWPDMEIREKLGGFEKISEFKELFYDSFYNDDKCFVQIDSKDLLEMLMPQ